MLIANLPINISETLLCRHTSSKFLCLKYYNENHNLKIKKVRLNNPNAKQLFRMRGKIIPQNIDRSDFLIY